MRYKKHPKMSLGQKYFSSGAQRKRGWHLAASCLRRRYNNLTRSPGSGDVRGDRSRIWQHIKILCLNLSPAWWYYEDQKHQNYIFSCFREQPQLTPALWSRKQELKKSPHFLSLFYTSLSFWSFSTFTCPCFCIFNQVSAGPVILYCTPKPAASSTLHILKSSWKASSAPPRRYFHSRKSNHKIIPLLVPKCV